MQQFLDRTLALAAALSSYGDLISHDRVAVLYELDQPLELIIVVHGLMLANLVPCLVEVNRRTSSESLFNRMQPLKAKLLIAPSSIIFNTNLELQSTMRKLNLEWERVVVSDGKDGFVSVADLRGFGKGIVERGVWECGYRRSGADGAAELSEEEAGEVVALVFSKDNGEMEECSHLDLMKYGESLAKDFVQQLAQADSKVAERGVFRVGISSNWDWRVLVLALPPSIDFEGQKLSWTCCFRNVDKEGEDVQGQWTSLDVMWLLSEETIGEDRLRTELVSLRNKGEPARL